MNQAGMRLMNTFMILQQRIILNPELWFIDNFFEKADKLDIQNFYNQQQTDSDCFTYMKLGFIGSRKQAKNFLGKHSQQSHLCKFSRFYSQNSVLQFQISFFSQLKLSFIRIYSQYRMQLANLLKQMLKKLCHQYFEILCTLQFVILSSVASIFQVVIQYMTFQKLFNETIQIFLQYFKLMASQFFKRKFEFSTTDLS
ncbi:unnamed protein product [Paramecium sonneborni]|uniref:Transmembrane protein n=1 Tax=Paramecium sonneborni TaxID=65129 RepID=A0A8S1RM88_9CILI|nr:unnamed protein product [Paramecium sonneborni]